MNVGFSPEEERFRSEVREFLADYRDLDGFFGQGHRWKEVKALFQAMGERGWLALAWPEEHGGLARSAAYEYILWDEVAYARAARNPLAAVRARADRDGDAYVITGQKCWQSYAQDMDYFWLLARTGTQESRGRGLSLFICDKAAPGCSVRPLPTLDDDQLNEVHFDAVRVPAGQLVGPENGAWSIMGEALADERHIQFPPGRVRRDLEEMVAWLRGAGLDADPVVRRTFADLAVRVAEVEVQGLRVLDAMQKGLPAVAEAAANKVMHTWVCQDIARAVLDLGGPEALVTGGRPELLWRQSMWETIGGGTSEIMLGVVAKQALGLSGRR